MALPMNNQDFNPGQTYRADNPNQNEQYLNNAYADPKYMAFKRAMGASDAVARAEAAQAINSARTAQGQLPGEYADMLGQSLRKISDQFENQGMFSSSNRLRAQNEQQGQLEGQMLGQRNQYQDTINGANISLAQQLAQGQMQNVEQQGAAADRVAQDAAGQGLNVLPASYVSQRSSRTGIR